MGCRPKADAAAVAGTPTSLVCLVSTLMEQPTTQSCESAVSAIFSALHLLLAEITGSELHNLLPVCLHYPVVLLIAPSRQQTNFDLNESIT
jgi:hypothetical protein